MKHIGFTGTRNGMTLQQRGGVYGILLDELKDFTLHHGDCVGADTDAHELACLVNAPIVIHPPVDRDLRSWCGINPDDGSEDAAVRWEKPRTHLARNRDIVQSCSLLIATPPTAEPQKRGGSWYTVRYAWKQGIRTIVVAPDGTVEEK